MSDRRRKTLPVVKTDQEIENDEETKVLEPLGVQFNVSERSNSPDLF